MKPFLTVLSLLIVGVSYGQSINDSLLFHYPFSGNADDASDNGFDGIVNASLTADRFGNPNEAFQFNGEDEYIDLPSTPELKPDLPLSFSFWIKLEDLQPQNTVLLTNDFSHNNHSGVWMNLSSLGFLEISYGYASGNTSIENRRTKTGTTPLVTDNWYHVAGVVNGLDDMEIYIDCVNDNGSYSGTGGGFGYTAIPGSIGRKDANTNLPAYYFMGTMDDVRYWNRGISMDDIDLLCISSLSTNEPVDSSISSISVFPNPAKDKLNIQVESNLEFERMEIFNAMGQSVYEGLFQQKVKVDQLSAGVYFLQLFKEDNEPAQMVRFIRE